jgi:hypothetical protein
MLTLNQFINEGALYTHYEPAAITAGHHKRELERNGYRIMGHTVEHGVEGNATHKILTKSPYGKNEVHTISDLTTDDKAYSKISDAECIRRTRTANAHDIKEIEGKKV